MSGSLWGSPPRMRGKEEDHHQRPGGGRITPAHAGKSYCSRRRGSDPQDHPRVCGEKHTAQRAIGYAGGSPPRMRGKVMFAILGSVIPRITPAYAGKRHSVFGYGRNTRDHPRVCGEKCEPKHDLFNEQGSPPRMRGKETAGQHCRRLSGITPAYAGKRPCSCRAMRRYGDHPRVCGEKTVMHNVAANKKGSPPRMRGKAEV